MRCNLIFVDREHLPTRQSEINRYLEHKNSLDDQGYIDFLNRLLKPSLRFLEKEMKCLDYGCGHTPVLSELLAKEGITCYNYDPLFGLDHPLKKYDFIFAVECFEHFFEPADELNRINDLLNPNGYLGIMTEQWESLERFSNWYYKRDFTHVSFFHIKTIEFICENYGYEIMYRDINRVVVLKKRH
jgi:2-polyprenyl-3-methyl-5-hydroxy-6-metoxy-1,4-benzoquinol methylase